MIARWLDDRIAYDGSQLRAHWILRRCGIAGDAVVAFCGPCDVRDDELADLADLAGPGIRGDDMLHFLIERFDDATLENAVLRQRLLAAIVGERLRARGHLVSRSGDDLWFAGRKLSISVATKSAVSTLMHFAINVRNAGTPVPTAALEELRVDPRAFAGEVLEALFGEEESIRIARAKVRGKGEA